MHLVHISDLHCGSRFDKEAFNTAAEEINELCPDVIVITGDLTEEGYLKEYQKAKELIGKFKCGRIIIGNGNHDYKHTGYLIFNKFFPMKGPHRGIFEFEESVIIMLGTARPDISDGEVGYRQILWAEKTLSEYPDKFKIVGMHHHLIPVPDTGMETNTVHDAGDVLRSLTQAKADLVLCGHKHRPWMWNIDDMPVIHAGTLSCDKFRGFYANSYNIIKIKKSKIQAEVKIVGGEKLEFDKILEGYKNLDW